MPREPCVLPGQSLPGRAVGPVGQAVAAYGSLHSARTSEGPMFERPTCIDCAMRAPTTHTSHTLIGQYGWRLSRPQFPSALRKIEWRCRTCWQKAKARKAAPAKGN